MLPGNAGFYDAQPKASFVSAVDPATEQNRQFVHERIVTETLNFIRQHRQSPFFCYAPWTPLYGRYEFPADDPAAAKYANRPWSVKAKVNLLNELAIAENTVVFFCSDHGAAERLDGGLNSCGSFKGRKRGMYEGGLRTPMLVRCLGKSPLDAKATWSGIFPTFCQLVWIWRECPAQRPKVWTAFPSCRLCWGKACNGNIPNFTGSGRNTTGKTADTPT